MIIIFKEGGKDSNETYLKPERDWDGVLGQRLDLMPPTIRDVENVTGPDDRLEPAKILKLRKSDVVGILKFNLFLIKIESSFKIWFSKKK